MKMHKSHQNVQSPNDAHNWEMFRIFLEKWGLIFYIMTVGDSAEFRAILDVKQSDD